MALEPGSKRGLGRDPSGLDIDTNQPRGLRPAESGHVLDVGPKKPLGAPLLKRVLVMAEQTLHPAVNLRAPATGEPHTLRGSKKCLDLNQTQLLCSKHADHPSSACPLRLLQAHLALESTPPLRLILRWTRVPLPNRGATIEVGDYFHRMTTTQTHQQTRVLVQAAAQACLDKKGEDTRILELDPIDSGLSDFFLVTSASNDRQAIAIADEIEYRLKKEFGTYPNSVEGRRQGHWILLDYVDFVVHVFLAERRSFYRSEEHTS